MGEQVLENNTRNKMSNIGIDTSSSPHFILVHGVSHGGWCWYKVRALLETSGCSVTCIDLKASGIDSSHPDSVVSFNDYNHPLLNLLASLPNHKKVIFVFSLLAPQFSDSSLSLSKSGVEKIKILCLYSI